ncbi:SAM-dependent methyltransferase [Streptosporangiaceae bacterium NEAU-GS5]|nr:SAM-dependent methyltransferase [Streptosporangiaceae bacterium NEAU-GS5]
MTRSPGDGVKIDTTVPHPARIYDYWLGGKDNFEADRQLGDKVIAATGGKVREHVRDNRAFMRRAIEYLAEQGIEQFLDIGTGIPTSPNVHEIAQRLIPETKVVYVDNDPMVLNHSRALLRGTPQGRIAYVQADLRDPDVVLSEAAAVLDFGRPMAITIVATLMFLEDPYGPVSKLLDATAPGSYVAISHFTGDFMPPEVVRAATGAYERASTSLIPRTAADVRRLFCGTDLVPPGLVPVFAWRPDPDDPDRGRRSPAAMYAGIGHKV